MKVQIELTQEQIRSIGKQLFNIAPAQTVPMFPVPQILTSEELNVSIGSLQETRPAKRGYRFKNRKRGSRGNRLTTSANVKKKIKNFPVNEVHQTGHNWILAQKPGTVFGWNELKNHVHAKHPTKSAAYLTYTALEANVRPPFSSIMRVGKGKYKRV